jgi:transcription termination factor Rho
MQQVVFYSVLLFGSYMLNLRIYRAFEVKPSTARNDSLIVAKRDTTMIWVVKILTMFVVNLLLVSTVLFHLRK